MDDQCAQIEDLFYSWASYLFGCVHTIDSLMAMVITIYIFKHLWARIFFHPNLKMIVGTLLILASLHCLVFIGNLIETCSRWFAQLEGCDLMRRCDFCLYFRVPMVFANTGMVLAQTAITIERTVASVSLRDYEHQGKSLGYMLVMTVLMTTMAACLWLFSTEDPTEMQVSCGSFSDATFVKANLLYTSLLCIDTINLGSFILIWKRNLRIEKSSCDTTMKYQIQENLYVLEMVFPIALSHFLIFGFDMGFLLLIRSQKTNLDMRVYRIMSMLGYVIPFFTICLPFMIITIELRMRRKRRKTLASAVNVDSTGEAYFRSLKLQWAEVE